MKSDSAPQPLPRLAVDSLVETPGDGDGVQPRQCARCRLMFDGDPTLAVEARGDWWLCPPCEAVLLPSRGPKSNVIPFRRPARDD